jgi:hypothetical protein
MPNLRTRVTVPLACVLAGAWFFGASSGSRDGGVREAAAKSAYESPYSYDQTWNSSLRLIRVDLGLKVSEKDEKNGYVLFEYSEKDRVSSASIELVRSASGVRVVCQIAQFPSYTEALILNRLSRKMREEYGTPPEKPSPQDAGPSPSDAGEDDGTNP